MAEPTFDIFRGASDKDAMWVDCVAGLSDARKRMEEIAAATPGEYFVFSALTRSVLVRINSRKAMPFEQNAKSA